MFDRTRDTRVGDTGKGSCGVVLSVGKTWRKRIAGCVVGFEVATGLVECTELDGNTGSDTD